MRTKVNSDTLYKMVIEDDDLVTGTIRFPCSTWQIDVIFILFSSDTYVVLKIHLTNHTDIWSSALSTYYKTVHQFHEFHL